MADLSKNDIKEAFLEALTAANGRPSSQSYVTGGSTLPGGDLANAWMNVTKNFAGSVATFGDKVAGFNAGVGDLVNAVKPLTALGGTLGDIVQNAAQFGAGQAERLYKNYMMTSQYGATGGNMVETNQAISNTRLTAEQYKAIILDQIGNLRALGVTQTDVIKNFGLISREILNDNGFLVTMQRMGFTTDQTVAIIKTLSQSMSLAEINNRIAQGTFRELVIEQGEKLRMFTNQFGTTAQKQLENREQLAQNAELYAKARTLENSANPEDRARGAMLKGEGANTIAGFNSPAMQDIINQVLTRAGGVATGPSADALNQLNSAALTRLMQLGQQFQYGNAQQQKEALQAIRTEVPKMLNNTITDRLVANRQVDANALQLYKEMIPYFNAQRGQIQAGGNFSQRVMDTNVVAEGQGRITRNDGRGPIGSIDPGAITSDAFFTTKTLVETLGVGFNDAITTANENLGEFNKVLEQIVYNPTLRSPEAFLGKLKEVMSGEDFKNMSLEEKFDNLPSMMEQIMQQIFPNMKPPSTRADTTFGSIGEPYETQTNLNALINENGSKGKREGVFSQNQIENIVRTALISGDATRLNSPDIGQIGRVATKISDAVSGAIPEQATPTERSSKTQDDVVEALADLNKTVSELVNLQKQSNKITESGLNKVADANSVYG